MILKFQIVYLTWSGERITQIVEAQSLPAAVDALKKKVNKHAEVWYTLLDAKRIIDE